MIASFKQDWFLLFHIMEYGPILVYPTADVFYTYMYIVAWDLEYCRSEPI